MTNLIHNTESFTTQSIVRPRRKFSVAELGKVAVLLGGRSPERAISLQSGQNILEALLRQGVDAHAIDPDQHLALQLVEGQFDRVFIALHGKEGEDGVVQGVLQMLGIPFTGSGVAASALAMDKARAKLVMHMLGLATPAFGVAKNTTQARELAVKIGFPVSIKPVAEGSSLGVTRVESEKEVGAAFNKAVCYGDVIIERWVEGKDFFVSILADKALPSVEVRTHSVFYDYEAKYESSQTQYLCPAPLSEEKEHALQDLAYRAFCALGCEGWARVDLIQDQEGHFWVLEVNTIPGMTTHSLFPMSAKAAGMSFDEVVMIILEMTIRIKEPSCIVGEAAQA